MSEAHVDAVLDRHGDGGLRRYWPTALVARWLDITRGEAATLVVVVTIALVLIVGGLPPVLRHRGIEGNVPAASGSSPPAGHVGGGVGEGATGDSAAGETAAAPGPSRTGPSPADGSGVGAAPEAAPVATPAASAAAPPVEQTAASSPSAPSRPVPPAAGEVITFARVGRPGAPYGLAVAADGTVYVGTDNGTVRGERGPSRILAFNGDGSPAGSISITGQPDDHAVGVTGLAISGDGTLTALDGATGRVLTVDVGRGRQAELGRLFDLPACRLVVAAEAGCEPGVNDDRPLPRALAYDARGTLYITDAAQGVIWRMPRGGKPAPWLAATEFLSDDGLAGIAVEPSGSLLVAVPQALDPRAPAGGGVYRVPVAANGEAGTPELVVGFDRGEAPTGVVLLPDQSIAVSVEAAVVVVDPRGAEARRVTATALSRPSGLAFLGDTLLAANTGTPGTTDRWSILAVGVQ